MGGSGGLLGLVFSIDADPSQAQAKLEAFQAQLKGTGAAATSVFTGAGESATRMGQAVTSGGKAAEEGLLGARESARLLTEDFGIRLPRSVTTAITNIGGIGPALSALAPAMLGLFAAKEIPGFVIKLGEILTDSKAIAAAWDAAAGEIKKADDEMNRLDTQHLDARREISLIGLGQLDADELRLQYAQNDAKLADEDSQNARGRLEAAEKQLENLRQQRDHLEKMQDSTRLIDAANNTIASYRLPKATAAVKEQEATVAKLQASWELAASKARNYSDDVDRAKKILDFDSKGGGAASTDKALSLLDRWAAAKTVFPKLKGELLGIPGIIEEIGKAADEQDFRRFEAFLAGDYRAAGFSFPSGGGTLVGLPLPQIFAAGHAIHELDLSTAHYLQTLKALPAASNQVFTPEQRAAQSANLAVHALGLSLEKLGETDMEKAVAALGAGETALRTFGLNAKQAGEQFGQAMESSIAAAIMGEKHIGRALEAALKSEIANLAARSAVHAIYETAVGFAYLAVGDVPSADLAFTSAAIFASVAAAFGAAARAIPGSKGESGGAGAGRGSGSGPGGSGIGGSSSQGQLIGAGAGSRSMTLVSGNQPPSGHLTIVVLGSNREAAAWGHGLVSSAIEQHGFPGFQNTRPVPVTPGQTR